MNTKPLEIATKVRRMTPRDIKVKAEATAKDRVEALTEVIRQHLAPERFDEVMKEVSSDVTFRAQYEALASIARREIPTPIWVPLLQWLAGEGSDLTIFSLLAEACRQYQRTSLADNPAIAMILVTGAPALAMQVSDGAVDAIVEGLQGAVKGAIGDVQIDLRRVQLLMQVIMTTFITAEFHLWTAVQDAMAGKSAAERLDSALTMFKNRMGVFISHLEQQAPKDVRDPNAPAA